MKKLLLSACVLSMAVFAACGDDKKEKEEEDKAEGSGPEVCECVNMDEETADEELKAACKEMQVVWKAKYDKASEDEKKALMEEIEACM